MQQVAVAIYFFSAAAFFLGAFFFLAAAFFGAVLFFMALIGLAAALGVVTFLATLGLAATGFCAARRRSAQPWVLVGRRHAERGAPAKAARQLSHTLPHPTAMQAATRRGSCGSCADAPRG